MDSLHYENIFETKGIEYLLVVGFLLLMIVFARLISYKRPAKATATGLGESEGHFVAPGHTSWLLHADGSFSVGPGVLPRHLIGNVETVALASPGPIKAGFPLALLRSKERQVTLRAPVDGTIEAVNEALTTDPAEAEAALGEDGWLVRFKPQDLKRTLGQFYFADQARDFVDRELDRLVELLTPLHQTERGAVVMADGGLPVRGLAHQLTQAQWRDFEYAAFGVAPPRKDP